MERNEAIESLRQLYSETNAEIKAALECLIPELRESESEDERMRKQCIKLIREAYSTKYEAFECIAWLKKQKERKNVLKWRGVDECGDIPDGQYVVVAYNAPGLFALDVVRDGRILHPTRGRYKATDVFYIPDAEERLEYIDDRKPFELKPLDYVEELKRCKENPLYFYDTYVKAKFKPAEWSDADNIGWDEAFACVTRAEKAAKNEEELQNAVTAEKWLKEIKFRYSVHPVKQEWSEEDEKKREFLIKGIEDRMGFGWASDPFSREELISWLENLRPQPKQEWSEEDKRMINNIVDDLCSLISWIKTFAGTIDIDATIEDIRGHIKWLRSLRSRPKPSDNWKPSEGQIQALERAIISLNSVDDIPILTELRDKLKKLM